MKKIDMQVTPKTIYSDIVTMPNPMLLGLTINYHNYSDSTLYMQLSSITSGSWVGSTVNLGALGSGQNAFVNLDNFASRTKPTGALTEILTVTLRGYTDAGYSNLLYTFSRDVTMIFIKSDDGSWTQDFLDNFNDGTVQGWASVSEQSCGMVLSVATDYVLSTPYSLKNRMYCTNLQAEGRARTYKSFTTPDRNTIYAIINIRLAIGATLMMVKYIRIQNGNTVLVHLGRQYDSGTSVQYVPLNKWMRVVVPLPKNVTFEFRVVTDHYRGVDYNGYVDQWIDDFKIISK